MNLRALFALLVCVSLPSLSLAAEPLAKTEPPSVPQPVAAASSAELTSQDTLADALRWLQEYYPLESLLEDNPDFFNEADDVVIDEASGLLLFAYRANKNAATDWLAWLGLDDDLVVVLIEGVDLNTSH